MGIPYQKTQACTNDCNVTLKVFTNSTCRQNSQYEQNSSYSLLANQSSCPQLDHEYLEQLDEFDLEEMDLKWQVAMILMRMKKFYKRTCRKLQFDAKEPVGFDKTKVECYNCHKTGHFARECRTKGNQDSKRRDAWNSRNKDMRRSDKQEDSKALVTIDREGVDWTSHLEEEEDYALMACNSSGLDTEKVEAQLVAHQQGQLWYEEKIRFMKIDLDDKTDVLTYHKKLLADAEKEKEDLKAKVEKWHNSSKNLDSEDEHVSLPTEEQETPSFANQQVKTPRETRMAKQAALNNRMRKKSSQREIRPIWNNVQRVNHENQFVPIAVLTRTGKIPVSTARASVMLGEKGKLLLSPQQVVIRDQKDITGTKSPNTMVDQVLEIVDYLHRTFQNKGIVDSGYSRHMTGNKAYLAEYQDFNGGPVAFGGSKGYITGKALVGRVSEGTGILDIFRHIRHLEFVVK
ncbi:ribonuclease H-like domain-containing protein [Tanacetum coccineum]